MKPNRRIRKCALCIARDEVKAVRILDELKELGSASLDISLLLCASDMGLEPAPETRTRRPAEQRTQAEESLFGGAIDWLSGVGSLNVPRLGRITAVGPLLAYLKAPTAPQNLTGRLVRLGVPESVAQRYENELRHGKILISHHSGSAEQARRVAALFRKAGGDDITMVEDDCSQEAGSGTGGQREAA